MSKKAINSKLVNLFSNISNQADSNSIKPEPILNALNEITGDWTWETDTNGIVIKCGKEISEILGFSPIEVIGLPLFSFGLALNEQQKLRNAINSDDFPVELELNYTNKQGDLVQVRTSILQDFDVNKTLLGYHGFSHRLLSSPETITTSGETNLTGNRFPTQATSNKKPPKRQNLNTRPLNEVEAPIIEDNKSNEPAVLLSEKPKVIKPRKQFLTSVEPQQRPIGNTAPLPPLPPSTFEAATNLESALNQLSGLSLSNEGFIKVESNWIDQVRSNLKEDELSATPAGKDAPAIISTPLKLRDKNAGVIEIIDAQSNRKWSEEDRLLVQEVTNQLGLALEKAELYSAVQKELVDKVKAEQETSKRNKDLAKLNIFMQKLTRLVSRDEIFNIVSTAIQDLFETDNLLISSADSDSSQLSFPICVVNGERVQLPIRIFSKGYQENILESQIPLLINAELAQKIQTLEFDHPNGLPFSMIAVPLFAGDRSLGVISVFDYRRENAFDEVQLELLSTIAGQTATALENSSLFLEISQALETIEVRERYQANATTAVASLSENGSSAVNLVLESLANASDCDRVSYVDFSISPENKKTWSVLSSFISTRSSSSVKSIENMKIQIHEEWVNQLIQKGYYQISINNASQIEKDFLDNQKSRSILLLTVKSDQNQPSCLMLENLSYPHDWQQEEINILRIVADSFHNTNVREGLLHQVQTSLDETENLYSASHRLALSNSLTDMIASIVEGINISSINRGVLVLFHYNSEKLIEKMEVEAVYYKGQGTPPSPVGTEFLISLYQPIFSAEDPVFYDDLLEAQIDEKLRRVLTSQNIRSMALLPLWSANEQLGVLLLQSSQIHRFQPQEMRSYPPLADQLSTAIENLRLFEQTQAALSETGLLYRVSNGISHSASLEEFVNLVGSSAMPTNADTLWLFTANESKSGEPSVFTIIGSSNTLGEYKAHGGIAETNLFTFIDFSKSEPVNVPNVSNSDLPDQTRNLFQNLDIATAAIIPLQTAGTPVGLLIASSKKLRTFEPESVRTLQIVGNSIAVAIERQRLLSETTRRALELQTAAEIARDTTSTLSLDILLNRIVNLLKDRFDYYLCSIYLLDEANEFATIQESTGEIGKELKNRNQKFAIGSKSVIGSCTASGEPVIINDVSNSSLFTPNSLTQATRSELGLPLKITGKVIGAIDIHSTQRDTFTKNELNVLQILADQVAVAVNNAKAYEVSQKAVEEMRELDRVKSQFLANMSHELRTPLNSVIGFSRVILKGIDGPINDTQEQDITAIYNSGMHLLNMINEILDLSKIEAGKMELQLDDVNLTDVINSAITTATGLIKDRPIELIQKVPSNLPTIRADEIRLSQVLINLISNAVKFTEKGSIIVEATMQTNLQNKPEILITVKDTGIGIAPQDQIKLFQRFSQVDDSPTRKTGGTGLGLSISRSLIEMHGGKIGLLSSEVGVGSVFYFTIPAPESSQTMNLDHLINGENVILSIDDDSQIISLYERFLKPHGYEVIALTDPTLAVERAREIRPFAITLDIMMPGKDGWQVLKELKKHEDTKDIPVMICSILQEEDKGFSLGASDYLVKPFLQDDLTCAIQRLNKDGEIHEVLIINDDHSDLEALKKMVEESGNYMVVLADGGLAAIQLLKDFTPDIIILDLFMPNVNGFDVMEKIKIEPRLNRIPLIVLTGTELESDQQKFLSEFGHEALTKVSQNESDLLRNLQQTLNKIRPTRLVN